MKKTTFILALISFLAIPAYAQNPKLLAASYQLDHRIPDNINQIPNEAIRSKVIEELKAKSTVYNLYSLKNLHVFTNSKLSDGGEVIASGEDSSYVDASTREVLQQRMLMSKLFLVSEEYDQMQWTIEGKDKVIAGRTCKRALFSDGVTVAWFCPEIPNSTGPMGYMGLPGLIFELETPSHHISLLSLEFMDAKDVTFVKPEGKTLTRKEFDELRIQKLKELGADTDKGGVQVIHTRM